MSEGQILSVELPPALWTRLRGHALEANVRPAAAARMLLARALEAKDVRPELSAVAALLAAEQILLILESALPDGEARVMRSLGPAAARAEGRLARLHDDLEAP